MLDLSRVLAGPFCTMNLADLGAEVIKIEMPGRGDDSRGYAPRIPNSATPATSTASIAASRASRSICASPRAREILLALARQADVVVENFSPGTMERFNLGYELTAANPRIILCSISGFGQSGPMAAAPAYDIVAQALGGTMSITGPAGRRADAMRRVHRRFGRRALRRRRDPGGPALRDRTGMGQHLDIAMLDCQVALLEDALARYSATGKMPGPLGSRHPSITPFQHFRAADGYFVAGCGNEAWERFCDAIGMPELKNDARFAPNADRTANHAELEPILAAISQPPARPLARAVGGRRAVRADRERRGSRRNPHLKRAR